MRDRSYEFVFEKIVLCNGMTDRQDATLCDKSSFAGSRVR